MLLKVGGFSRPLSIDEPNEARENFGVIVGSVGSARLQPESEPTDSSNVF
jgi:hypothetical protein